MKNPIIEAIEKGESEFEDRKAEMLALFHEESIRLFTHPKGGLSVLLDYPPHDKVLDEKAVSKFIERMLDANNISNHLSQLALLQAVVEGMKGERWHLEEDGEEYFRQDYWKGYNQALTDQISSLTTIIKELEEKR